MTKSAPASTKTDIKINWLKKYIEKDKLVLRKARASFPGRFQLF